jgi:hypothetical protein
MASPSPLFTRIRAALPPLALLLAAGQRLAEEREVLVVDRLGRYGAWLWTW